VRQPSPVSSLFAEPRDYLCPTDSAATVASVPTQEMRSAARQNGRCNGDRLRRFDFIQGQVSGSKTVIAKKKVYFTDSLRFKGQDPVSRSGKATGRRAFEVQSEQAISAAYYCDLAARDNIFADGAVELVIERVPCSASIDPSQSCELIFCARLDRLRGRKHAGDGGKFRRDLQEQNGRSRCLDYWRLIPCGSVPKLIVEGIS
jgi:hypothetical protein